MSGIIFNGVEMKEGENESEYIKRVFDKMNIKSTVGEINNILNECKKEKKTKDSIFNIDDDLSETDDSETDTEPDTDTDTEPDTKEELIKHTDKYFKFVKLETRDCTQDEHNDVIKWFNRQYGTDEEGHEGHKGNYKTYGETPYNLYKLKDLKSLYDRKINKVNHFNITVHITFKNLPLEDYKIIEEYQNIINNFRSQRDENKHIELNDCIKFNHLLEYGEVENYRDYNKQKSTVGHVWNINDVVFDYTDPHLKNICFWQVVKITNKRIKVRPLRPILTVKHYNNHSLRTVNLMKYTNGDFINDIKARYLNKNSHNSVYKFDDYIYRIFTE